jgi:3-keto-5-aminohexanoate cleavage enzyme
MAKMVITCAVSGAEVTREHNPNLPISPAEIADAAADAQKAGAAILHLHVRDKDGKPTQDLAVFKDAISRIRAKCDIVIEVTTGGAVGMTAEERLAPVALDPEMASLDCGTVNFGDDYFVNSLPMMRTFATAMRDHKVQPTLECFDLSHIDNSKILLAEGLVQAPFHYGLVMNVPGAVRYDADTLGFFARRLPAGSNWTAIGIGGRASHACLFAAIALGGFIRVGFEDNIYFNKGVLADSNAQLVERAASIARSAGAAIATSDDVRKLFKLRS